jgi:hypothetical protein
VDGQPARGTSACVAERVGHPWWNSDEPAGRDNDRFRVVPELEGQFSLEDVEGIGVFVVNVRAGDLFAGCLARVGDRHISTSTSRPRRSVTRLRDRDPGLTPPVVRMDAGPGDRTSSFASP